MRGVIESIVGTDLELGAGADVDRTRGGAAAAELERALVRRDLDRATSRRVEERRDVCGSRAVELFERAVVGESGAAAIVRQGPVGVNPEGSPGLVLDGATALQRDGSAGPVSPRRASERQLAAA